MDKTVEKQHNRTAFIRQPARVLLVDLSPPFDADTCEYLHDALVNFFSLVTHLSGPCRTPFFGLFALTSDSENLFTLQHVRGNFPRLHTAFEELKFFFKENSLSTCTPDVIQQALKEAAAQFKRQSQSLRQMSTSSCQLEIIFLTCRTAISVSKHIEKFSKNIELENLKKIQVVNVQSSEEFNRKEDDTRSEDNSSPGTDDDEMMEGGLVDVISLGKDILSFQNFFKTWLLDGGTDQEHLRISLPSAFTQDSEGDQDHIEACLTLKCDLHECLLDPLHLPYQSCFSVCSESSNLTGKGVAITKPNVLSYPVYNLTAVKLVNTEAVCESVLFGMPYIVRPTLCWKLDWEELESNQQHFYALCSVLKERGVSLLAKSVGQSVVSRGRQQQSVSASPQGHFLLIPSDNSLLLKSIAVSEMMLPRDAQTPVEGPSDSALSVVASCLDQIEFSNTYNPLLVHSDLYKCLISQSLKSSSASKSLKRRGFQAPQKSQSAKQATNSGQTDTTSTNRQTKRVTPRAQVRRVVFTAPKESTSQIPQTNEFRSAGTMLSMSKRFRSNSAANLYNSSPPPFPDNLEL